MLLLKYIIIFCVVLLSSCNGYFNKYSSIAKSDNTTKIEIKQNKQLIAVNNQSIKDNISKIEDCADIDLEAISVDNFSFTENIVKCLKSSPEFYKYVLFLYKHNSNKADKQLQKLITYNSKKNLSLDSIISIADKKILLWLDRKSNVIEPQIIKPELNKRVEKIVLEQGEFEVVEDFEKRVAKQKEIIQQKIQLEQQVYQAKLEEYYRLQEAYMLSLRAEKENRRQQSKEKYLDFLGEEIRNILGYPYFYDLSYNPNTRKFTAILSSTKSSWYEYVLIDVPLIEAKVFKESIKEIRPILNFDINNNGELYVSNISANFNRQNYNVKIEKQKTYKLKSEVIEATFGDWL